MLSRHIFLAMTSLVLVHASAHAQYPRQKPNKKPPIPVKTISTPVAFPDVPPYTGQVKFISGDKVDSNSGEELRQTWHIKEGRAQAIEWYKNALSSAGWKVTAGKGTVSATKKEAALMIFINEIPLPDNYRSELMMQYSKP